MCLALVRKYSVLDALQNPLLDPPDFRFIALIKRPLLDSLGAHEPGMHEDFHVFAGGGLGHAQLLGNEHAADPVSHEVPVSRNATCMVSC